MAPPSLPPSLVAVFYIYNDGADVTLAEALSEYFEFEGGWVCSKVGGLLDLER